MGRALTTEDLFKIERLSQITLSPDGQWAWIGTRRINLDENQSTSHVWRVDMKTKSAEHFDLKEPTDFAFSHDGKCLFFVSEGHIFAATPDGSHVRQITFGFGGASHLVPSPNGDRVLFTRTVYLDAELQSEFEKTGADPSLAKIYHASHPKACVRSSNSLMYRHWDSWCENKRNHLFVVDTQTGQTVDLTPWDADVPPIALDSGNDYAFSPDGKTIAFVMNPDKVIARSTNNSIYVMSLDGLTPGSPKRVSDTDGCDTYVRFISNREIGYCSMLTPGYEADAVRLKVYTLDTGKTRLYLTEFERSVEAFEVLDDRRILILAQDFAHKCLYILSLEDGSIRQITSGRSYMKFAVGGGRILVSVESLTRPAECAEIEKWTEFEPRTGMDDERVSEEKLTYLTHFGDVLKDVEMHDGICTHYAFKDLTLEGYVVTPPGFDPSKKYPLILLIHGGPQGAFEDSFHYRWNVQMFAARGAIAAFCNPHGSTGYGHALTRAISRHWSDDCPDAIMAFVDHILKEFPQIDENRMTAAGASFGGFMINWLMGHTDRFRAFVSHDGIFNTQMSGYITDELWFCDYEFGGTPYDNAAEYDRHSPHHFVKNFKTPTLVVQGEQDFRCFISEGVALFTALQYMGVESRLVYFPQEGHWVLKPADSAVWYEEVVGWLMSHV
ncbi:MAG: S9 family peptidase [Proteobacteria bacterium]|nr:S9 family peptidase [Pseudomonadota bacterium]